MKVVHAAKLYVPDGGGMETVLRDLCDGTAGRWDVQVVAAASVNRTITEKVGDVSVVRAAAHGKAASVPLCPTLPLELWRARADCVVLHEPNPIAGTSLFLKTPAPHLVVWHHSDLVRPFWAPPTYGRIQRALYRRADCVIVSSPALIADSALVQHARRVVVIPFGIDLNRYTTVDPIALGRVQARLQAVEGPRMLFVGRLVYYKGLEVLLDAMTRAPGSLVIVGEGPLEGALRRVVAEKRLGDRVLFAGHVADADLPAYYHATDLLVLPSIARTEAFGVVQIEAMASGRPVVSTRLPTGVPWVNQDGVSGIVVPPRDSEALAAALTRLVTDDVARRRLGMGARRRAQAVFTRERMVESFRDVIERVVSGDDPVAEPLVNAGGVS